MAVVLINDLTSPLLTSEQVATRLGMKNHKTLAAWRKQGKGPPWIKVGLRLVRYDALDLARWTDSLKATPVAAQPAAQPTPAAP